MLRTTTLLFLTLALASISAADVPAIPSPQIPDKTFNIADYGAIADGAALNTDAIAKTIDAARLAGGGIIVVPAGKFLTGPIQLSSKMNLHLDEGATLIFTDDFDAFPITKNRHQVAIGASGCTDVAITGPGVIDGQGEKWWIEFRKIKGKPDEKQHPRRPNLVDLSNCQRVLVKDVTLKNSPMFALVPRDCDDVVIDSAKFLAPDNAPNTDGIDPSGHNYLITRCLFDTGDDCIAFKPQRTRKDGQIACENILVTDCTFKHGHGLSIGGQTPGGMRKLTVRNCAFDGTDAGIRMKAPRGEGGLVEDLTYENITMKNVKLAIFITSYYPNNTTPADPDKDPLQPVTKTTPIWRSIRIANLAATDCQEAGRIFGLPEMPVANLTLTNVNIAAATGLRICNASDVHLNNCKITAASGEPLITANAKITHD